MSAETEVPEPLRRKLDELRAQSKKKADETPLIGESEATERWRRPSYRRLRIAGRCRGRRLRLTSRLMCFSSALNPDLLPACSPLLEPTEHCDRCNNRRRFDASS